MSRKRPCTLTLNIKEGPEVLRDIQDCAKRSGLPVSRYLIGLHLEYGPMAKEALKSNPTAQEAKP